MGKYDYLKKYVNIADSKANENSFYTVQPEEILEAEEKLTFNFPKSLKEFWLEIGYGFFRASIPEKNIQHAVWSNRLVHPLDIASIMLEGEDSGLITSEGIEMLQEGHMPFFEVGDSTSYLVMRPESDTPNAVYWYDTLIEDSLETFIWKLYHESPIYYLNKV